MEDKNIQNNYIIEDCFIGNEKFYVYELWNPIKNLPFYVGKGKDKRYLGHFLNYHKSNNKHKINTIKNITCNNNKVIIKIVYKTNNEKNALEKEIELIKLYGRKDNKTGFLTNLTNGGEGLSGFIPSNELKRLWSVQRSNEGNGMYGKKHTKNSLELMSINSMGLKNGFYKKKHSKEWIKKLIDNNPAAKQVDDSLIIKLSISGFNPTQIHKLTKITKRIIVNRIKKYKLCTNSKQYVIKWKI